MANISYIITSHLNWVQVREVSAEGSRAAPAPATTHVDFADERERGTGKGPEKSRARSVRARQWTAGLPTRDELKSALIDPSSPVHALAVSGTLGGRWISVDVSSGNSIKVRALRENVGIIVGITV